MDATAEPLAAALILEVALYLRLELRYGSVDCWVLKRQKKEKDVTKVLCTTSLSWPGSPFVWTE